MTETAFRLRTLEGPARWLLVSFLVTMAFGYASGLYFVRDTTHLTAKGTEEQFRGNEETTIASAEADLDAGAEAEPAGEIKFAKATPEMLTIIHTHVTSYALIFLGVGAVFLGSSARRRVKTALLVEPFVATCVLFGGMGAVRYLSPAWAAPSAWLMMLAGLSTTVVFAVMVGWSLWELCTPRSHAA